MSGIAILKEQTLSSQVLSLNGRMEKLAAAGEWRQVMEFMTKRNAMLGEIEGSKREAAIVAARRSTDQILMMAETEKQDIADRLAAVQHGRMATDSYKALG